MADMDGTNPIEVATPPKSAPPKAKPASPDLQGQGEATQGPGALSSPRAAVHPEEKAVRWAQRNRWFGTDEVRGTTARAKGTAKGRTIQTPCLPGLGEAFPCPAKVLPPV